MSSKIRNENKTDSIGLYTWTYGKGVPFPYLIKLTDTLSFDIDREYKGDFTSFGWGDTDDWTKIL